MGDHESEPSHDDFPEDSWLGPPGKNASMKTLVIEQVGAPQIQYLLTAWSLGHYARVARIPSGFCPYLGGSKMALAWVRGWRFLGDEGEPKSLGVRCSP